VRRGEAPGAESRVRRESLPSMHAGNGPQQACVHPLEYSFTAVAVIVGPQDIPVPELGVYIDDGSVLTRFMAWHFRRQPH
jgi:hypothetical protein